MGAPARSLEVNALPGLVLVAGETRSLSLGEYVRGEEEAIAWSVAGAAFLRVDLGPGGQVTILAPDDRSGREVLVFTATGASGGRATALLEVRILEALALLKFGQVPPLEMTVGEQRAVDLAALLEASAGEVQWSVAGSGVVAARLEPGAGLVLEAVAAGADELLLTATDATGQRASEVLRVTVTGPSRTAGQPLAQVLELSRPEPVRLEAHGSVSVPLDPLVRAGTPDRVTWQVTGGVPGLASIEPGSRILVLQPGATTSGEHEILLTATLDTQIATLALPVHVGAAGWGLHGAAAVEVVAGEPEVVYSLDRLVAVGDPGEVVWQVSGGLFVTARIDIESRSLALDASHGVPGREVFRLEARADGWRAETALEVMVAAPEPSLLPLPSLTGSQGDTITADLAPYLSEPVDAERVTWRVVGPEGVEAWIGASGALTVVISGDVEIQVEVETHWGAIGYGLVSIAATDPEAGRPASEPTNTESLPPPISGVPQNLILPGPFTLDGGQGRVRLADFVPSGVEIQGDGDFEVALMLTTVDGFEYAGSALVRMPARDATAPAVDLRLRVDPDHGRAYVRVRVDEPLAALPRVWVDGAPLVVEREEGEFVAQYSPTAAAGIEMRNAHIEAAATDASGNVGRASAFLTHGVLTAGLPAPGPDGLMVHAPPAAVAVPVWIHAAPGQGGRYIGFDRGAAPWVEVQFARAEPGTRLERLEEDGWAAVPARVVVGSGLWALVDASGVYRLTQGMVTPTGLGLEVRAFPNPFNAAIALRVVAPVPGLYTVCIYDATGGLVRRLAREVRGAGVWSVAWDGRSQSGLEAASGVYLARVRGPAGALTAKLVLVR